MKKTESASARPRRQPPGQRGRLLFLNLDPSREYRLIKSTPERIHAFTEVDEYRIENIRDFLPKGVRVEDGRVVDNELSVGGGDRHILVSIEKSRYLEGQAAKEESIRATENAIQYPNKGFYGKVTFGQDD